MTRENVLELQDETPPVVEVLDEENLVIVEDELTKITEVEAGQGPQGPIGPEGPEGPQGPQGSDAEDKYYRHQQSVPETVWTIEHNLNKRPAVESYDSSGDLIEGDIVHVDNNTVTIAFSSDVGGEAYLN